MYAYCVRMVLEKNLQSSVAQFEFSCTYLAHGHDVQQNVGLTFFIQRLQTFFLFLPCFYVFDVFYFCLNVFTFLPKSIYMSLWSTENPPVVTRWKQTMLVHFEIQLQRISRL